MASKPLLSIWNVKTTSWVNIGWSNPVSSTDIPTPSSYNGLSSTYVNSGRNADGKVIGDVILSDVSKIEITWNFLTVAQFSKLAKLFEAKYDGSFFVACCFFDVVKGGWDGDNSKAPSLTAGANYNPCRVFYPNDRQVSFAKIKLDTATGAPIGYQNVSLSLIDTGKLFGE